MRENFHGRYKSRDFVSFYFVFAVNYVRDKNALYGIVMSPDHITAGTYNRDINKRLARSYMVWLRETS